MFDSKLDVDKARMQFAQNEPFRWCAMDGFFEPATAKALLEQFPRFDDRFARNEMGELGGKAVRTRVRELGSSYQALDDFLQTEEFLTTMSRITGIPDLKYDPDYEGGGTHDNVQGQGLANHVDFNYHPRTGWHRRLNLIVYLNPEWEEAWGGCLELHSNPWDEANDRAVSVLPLLNRAVIFETNERSWHGFNEIRLPDAKSQISRKSFAIYLYTETRPAEETAPSHGTVYVPPGMPKQLEAGKSLTADEVRDLRVRFAGLRGQLKYLYGRELDYSAQIAAQKHQIEELKAALGIPVLGFVKSGAASGFWPDRWCAQVVLFNLEPTRAAKVLRLKVWAPPQHGATVLLQLSIEGRTEGHRLRPGVVETIECHARFDRQRVYSIELKADRCWQPAAHGEGDSRALAYRLVEAELE